MSSGFDLERDRHKDPEREEASGDQGSSSSTSSLMAVRHRRWIQRKAERQSHGSAAIPESGGQPLDGNVRRSMEGQLGADLSGVQVHTGSESAQAARQLNARAFTVDQRIHFNTGEFAPGSKEGDRLLAHELTHVVQGQKSGIQRKAHGADGAAHGDHPDEHEAAEGEHAQDVSEPGDPAEKEADAAADHVADKLHGGEAEAHGGGAAHADGEKPSVGAAAPATARKVMRKSESAPAIVAAAPATARKIMRKPTAPGKMSERGNRPAKSAGIDEMLKDLETALVAGPFTRQREVYWNKKLDEQKANPSPGVLDQISAAKERIAAAVTKADSVARTTIKAGRDSLDGLLKKLTPTGKEPATLKAGEAKKEKEKVLGFDLRQWISAYKFDGSPVKDEIAAFELKSTEVDAKISSVDKAEQQPQAQAVGGNPADAGAKDAGAKTAASTKPEAVATPDEAVAKHDAAKPTEKAATATKSQGPETDTGAAKTTDAGKQPAAKVDAAKPEVFKPPIDPIVDPVGALRAFIVKGFGWPEVKKAYGENEAQMTAMVQLRRTVVDPLLDDVCKLHSCKKEMNGSVNLTSDYDLSLSPTGPNGNPAQAVAEFNSRFRAQWGMESGTVFDTNVYDKGEAMSTKAGEQKPEKLNDLEKSSAFTQGNDRIQDVASLVKIRKYMKPPEWDAYKVELRKSAPDDKRPELAARISDAERQYNESQAKLNKYISQLTKTDPKKKEEIPEDILLEAANKAYADALVAVQKARNERADLLAKVKEPPAPADPALQALIVEKDVQLRKAMAESLDFANEAYNSEGALIDVVGVQQGAFGAKAKDIKLSPQEALSSFNEQFGDALKDLEHYGHAQKGETTTEHQRFLKAMVQTSKYVLRMVDAGEQICGMPTKDAEKPKPELIAELARLKTACTKMKELRADPKLFAEKSETVPATLNPALKDGKARDKAAPAAHGENAAITPQSYGIDIESIEAFRGLLLSVNLEVNQIARKLAEVGNAPPAKAVAGGPTGAAAAT